MADVPLTRRDLLTTKGDLYVHNGTDLIRVGVGADDQVLTADAAAASGVKWAAGGGGGGGSGAIVVESRLNAAQSVANNTDTGIAYDTDDYDPDDWHNPAVNPSRFTVPAGAAGDYRLEVLLSLSQLADGAYWQLFLHKNGTTTNRGLFDRGSAATHSMAVAFHAPLRGLVAGDYIEARVLHQHGSARDLLANRNWLTIYKAS